MKLVEIKNEVDEVLQLFVSTFWEKRRDAFEQSIVKSNLTEGSGGMVQRCFLSMPRLFGVLNAKTSLEYFLELGSEPRNYFWSCRPLGTQDRLTMDFRRVLIALKRKFAP